MPDRPGHSYVSNEPQKSLKNEVPIIESLLCQSLREGISSGGRGAAGRSWCNRLLTSHALSSGLVGGMMLA